MKQARTVLVFSMISFVACSKNGGQSLDGFEVTSDQCGDTIDNDDDGLTDCADDDCADFVFCLDSDSGFRSINQNRDSDSTGEAPTDIDRPTEDSERDSLPDDSDTTSDGDIDGDSDADGDGDADSDSDSDTDADTDVDSDADADSDTDNDADADTDSDSDTGVVVNPNCGNDTVEDDEVCDGEDLQGESCESLNDGFIGGDLRCNSDCTGYLTNYCETEALVRISNQCESVQAGYCNAARSGNCYYIDPTNGDDNNPGTYQRPWRTTLNINTYLPWEQPSTWVGLSPGDVVYFMEGVHRDVFQGFDGVYGQVGLYLQDVFGQEDMPIVFRNYPGHHAVIDPGGEGMGIFIYQSSNILVEGLEVTNATYRGIYIDDSQNILVSNVAVSDTDGWVGDNIAGIAINISRDITLRDSIIYDNYDREAALADAQTENSCNMVLFRNGGAIIIQDNVFFQSQDYNSPFSGCGIKYKHSSVERDSQFILTRNYFENHKFAAIGVSTLNATITHNIINGVGNNTVWGVGRAFDSRDWGGLTHQQNQLFEYNTVYSDRGFFLIPTLEDVNDENGPWDDLNNIAFRSNIIYSTRFGGESPIEIYDATADDLYMAVRDGIDFESNCYFDPNEQMSFNFAASSNFGEMGGLYTLSEWQSEHDWERDSVETDPQFSDADAADFTVNNANCADRGALSQGVSVSTDKVFRILCED